MELLEREQFLEDLAAALNRVEAGTGHTVLVSGEAGIGKTVLVEGFIARQEQTTRVLWGLCDALFTPRPLGPLHDIAHQTRTDLLALLDAGAPRTTLLSAFLNDLQQGAQPTIVVLEDIHWADEATLDLIKFLGRRIHRTRSLLILTCRYEELAANHPLRLVLGDLPSSTTTRLSLPPLSAAAVEALARRAQRPYEGLHAATDGNPFFVTEVLANTSPGVPSTVRDAVLALAARLSSSARELLDLVSVVPARTERWILDAAFALQPFVLDECVNAGMLRDDDISVSFRHELARRAIDGALPPARRQHLHTLVLRAMIDRGLDAVQIARLAHHASGARDGAAVLRFAPAAARQASSLRAHREAAAHYASAMRFADRLPPEEAAALSEGQSYELLATGQFQPAMESQRTALTIWRQLGNREAEGRSLRWMSRYNWLLGRRAEAERYAVTALELLEGLPPGRELAMAYSNRAQLHQLAQETAAAVHWGSRAIQLANALGDQETLTHALINVGTAEAYVDYDRGRTKLEESLNLALKHSLDEHAMRAINNLATLAMRNRDYARAAQYLTQGINFCTERDIDPWAWNMQVRRAQLRLQQGDWTGVEDEAKELLKRVSFGHTRILALVLLGQVRARSGGPEAQEPLDEARDLARETAEFQDIGPVAVVRAEVSWLNGDMEACIAEARPGYDLALTLGDRWFLGELSFWMWRGGGLKNPPPGVAEPFALQMTGDWLAAAAGWERLGCPYERAMALADGDEEARKRALVIFEQLGAKPAAEIVRRGLKALGARAIPRGPRAATKSNPAGLTARELDVLALLASGLPDAEIAARLFVSPKTVGHHVSAVLAKLSVRSRREAVATAYRLGIIEAPH